MVQGIFPEKWTAFTFIFDRQKEKKRIRKEEKARKRERWMHTESPKIEGEGDLP